MHLEAPGGTQEPSEEEGAGPSGREAPRSRGRAGPPGSLESPGGRRAALRRQDARGPSPANAGPGKAWGAAGTRSGGEGLSRETRRRLRNLGLPVLCLSSGRRATYWPLLSQVAPSVARPQRRSLDGERRHGAGRGRAARRRGRGLGSAHTPPPGSAQSVSSFLLSSNTG